MTAFPARTTLPVISVVINTNFGGFSLSREAAEAVLQRKGIAYRLEKAHCGDALYPYIGEKGWSTVMDVCERHDPDLVAAAGSANTALKIVDFTIGVEITDYDGKETARIYGSQILEYPISR